MNKCLNSYKEGEIITSIFSFIFAVLYSSISIFVVAILRKQTWFLVKYSTLALKLTSLLALIRLILPLDFEFTYIIESQKIFPAIENVLTTDIRFGGAVIEVWFLITLIWSCGALHILVSAIKDFLNSKKIRAEFTIIENAQAKSVFNSLADKRVTLKVSPDVKAPFIVGFRSAIIYLPEAELTDSELQFILLHELQHKKSHDNSIKMFYLLLSMIFWWNPLVHRFRRELDQLLELRCDRAVTKKMPFEEKKKYLTSILKVIELVCLSDDNKQELIEPSTNLLGTQVHSDIEQRFYYTLYSKDETSISQIVFSAALLCAFLFSYLVIIQPVTLPNNSEVTGSTIISPENAYILIDENGKMHLFVEGEYFWEIMEDELQYDVHADLPIYRKE